MVHPSKQDGAAYKIPYKCCKVFIGEAGKCGRDQRAQEGYTIFLKLNNSSRENKRKSLLWLWFGYVFLITITFCRLKPWISPRIIDHLRSHIKHLKVCFIRYPNTLKSFKKTRLRLIFSTYFSVFGYLMKHAFSCLICYIHTQTSTISEHANKTCHHLLWNKMNFGDQD